MRERTGQTASATRGRRRRSAPLVRLGVLLALVMSTSACALLPVEGATVQGRMVHGLYVKVAILALLVMLGVLGTLAIELVRFRKRDDATAPQDHGKPWVVVSFFGIGLVLVAVLFPSGESTLSAVDEVDETPGLDLVMTGSQWQWAAAYPDQGFTVAGQTYHKPLLFELPVDTSVRIDLRSTDVMHEFYVPDFLFMRNAIPGHPNVFSFTPDRKGTFHGQCAQLCGVAHYQMRFTLKVVSPARFHQWVLREKSEAQAGNCPPATDHLELTAHQVAWSAKCLAVPPDTPFTVTMHNEDEGVQHNFSIYDGPELGKNLFKGPLFNGPATRTLRIPALPAGTYYFQCDVHGKAMSGTLIVGTQHEESQQASGRRIKLVAKNVAWNVTRIQVPAGKPVTITMENEDPGTAHDFAVYDTSALGKRLFLGPLFKGIATKIFHVPALPAGTYYFQCDVHGQAMSGQYIVQ